MTDAPFLKGVSVESVGLQIVAPADGMDVVWLFMMPLFQASANMYGYASEDRKFPMISARKIRGCVGCMHVQTVAAVDGSVEYPATTTPCMCRVRWRAPSIALPPAARLVSTMTSCTGLCLFRMA